MDVWIVAVAAGAGYVAQRLKNLTMRNHISSNLSSEDLDFVQKVEFGEEICRQREHAYYDVSAAAIASTSGFEGENLLQLDNFASWGMVSDSFFSAGLSNKEGVQGDWEGRISPDADEIIRDSMPQPSPREIGFSYGFRRNRSRRRSRRIDNRFIKPRTSLESCLMAQLYKEHAEVDEYTYCVHPPQKPTIGPYLVTAGSRKISRAPYRSCSKPTGMGKYKQLKDTHSQQNKTILSVPRLPKAVAELQMASEADTGKEPVLVRSNTSNLVNGNQSNEQDGSSDGALLFFLGLTMGISYSLLGHKREVEKLSKLLRQTENLVQDLQEELEMKDVLTVKELAVEDYDSSDVHNDSYFDDSMQTSSLERELDGSSMYCNDGNGHQNTKEESLRKIEKELEAELGRLESNMNSSGLEGKLSNVAELDPDLVSYVVEGELRADLFGAETQAYAERDESSSSTPRSAHYPVSPRELSLRLHQVIQSRLEDRVKELETALEYSQRKTKCMESEHIRSWSEFPNYKTGSSSNHESPTAVDGLQYLDQPVVLNLSGEALAAYNEAYDELTKLSESDEEESNHQEIFHPHGQDLENGCLNSCIKQQELASNGSLEIAFNFQQEEDADDAASNNVICSSRDESEDGEDERERLLIRQIVEKARQGSPAVLNAQRAFLSTHEN